MPVVTMPDGAQVRFPDDMPPDQIRAMILSKFPDAAQRAAAPPAAGSAGAAPVYSPANPASPNAQPNAPVNGVQWYEPGYPLAPTPAEPTRAPLSGNAPPALTRGAQAVEDPVSALARFKPRSELQAGIQGAGHGLVGLGLMPAELTATALNVGAGVTNAGLSVGDWILRKLGGDGFSPRLNVNVPSPTDTVTGLIAEGAKRVGVPVMDPETMSPRERLAYNVNSVGAEAAGMTGMLSRLAGRMVPVGSRPAPSMIDPLVRPYTGPNAGRTVAGDAAAAAGAGTALTGVEQSSLKDSATAKTMAMLGGGAAGVTLLSAAQSPATAVKTIRGFTTDTDVPRDAEGRAYSRRIVNRAAEFVQGRATDPAAAEARYAERVNASRANGDPVVTAGIGSDDIGLSMMEQGARLRDPRAFRERDQQVLDSAQQKVVGLQDPTVDQGAVTRFANDRPVEIAAQRDTDALPLLRQAEQAGARVDAQPVVDMIDNQLATVKRPAVVSALKLARDMLFEAGPAAVGPDGKALPRNVDTSVSGLYEARKAINDIIEGRTENATGRFAKRELIQVRAALDDAITSPSAVPEFGRYLDIYRTGSRPLDVFAENRSLAELAKTDPRNVAKKLLSVNEYGTEQTFREINQQISSNPEAARAWRAAVAEVLVDNVTNTNTALTGGAREGPVSIANLQKVFKQQRDRLAEVFSPDQMNTLQAAHKMLEPFGNLSRRATVGSQTAENNALLNNMEAAVLAYTGNAIATGMIMRRIRTAANLMPGLKDYTAEAKINRLATRMFFDPELFSHLMTRPIAKDPPAWNAKLNRLLGYGEAAREYNDTE